MKDWIIPAACGLASLINYILVLNIRASIAELRNEIGKARGADKEELKEWINGSFMRTKLVEAEMKAYEIRLDHMEKRLDP